jgi:hypothetical protein
MIRSLLFQASMLARYWVEGFHTATYLLNHLPCKAINVSYPYVALYGVAPSYDHLRVFGCVCYANLSAQATHKLPPPSSTRCVFLGYSTDHKGYRCLDLSTTNIIVSRHVFDKVVFPFAVSSHLTNDLDTFLQDDAPGAAPMPAPLPAPRVPAAGRCWQSDCTLGWSDRVRNRGWRSDCHLGRSDRSPPHGSFVGCLADFCAAPTTSAAPHTVPTIPPAPRAAPVSTTPLTHPAAPVPQHYSRRTRAAQEPPTLPLHQHLPSTLIR